MQEDKSRLALAQLALEGLSIGDAFGERFFGPTDDILARIQKRILPQSQWRWTDDTAMACSVVEILAEHQGIDPNQLASAFARRFAKDPDRGYGGGAFKILHAIALGTPWQKAATSAFNGQGSFGNGGAMRSAPIGAYFWDDYYAVVKQAKLSAEPTHSHAEGRAGAIAVAVAAAAAKQKLEGHQLFEIVLDFCPEGETRQGIRTASEIGLTEKVEIAASILGSGQSVSAQDTVPFCIWAAIRHLNDFEEAMWNTVSALGDRDTTCAIVGGIVAMAVGNEGIPEMFCSRREPLPDIVKASKDTSF